MKKFWIFSMVFVLVLTLAAGVALAEINRGGIVKMTASKQGVLIKNFNPFSPNALHPTQGCFYEPLVFTNVYTGEIQPWLSEKYTWSKDLKTLTFDLRKNVTWNDGKPFTADDVIFTLELGKSNAALDLAGVWSQGLVKVTKVNDYQVKFTFKDVNTTILANIGGIYIVPQHIWKAIENPSEWTGNENPVGTGPFVFDEGSFTEQSYRLKRNPNYWKLGEDGKPLPYIDGVQYIGATGNSQAAMKIISGELDWGTYFIANIDKTYVRRDPKNNHYWLPEGNIVYLNLNNGKEPFSNRNVRRAVAMAINQEEITTIMNSGARPADHSAVKKGYMGWVSKEAKQNDWTYSVEKAIELLEKEGYKKNSKGIMEKDGQQLSFNLYVPTGWTDWITAVDVISNQLSQVGIEARVSQVAWPSPFLDNITKGDYAMSIDYANSGASPYYQFQKILPSRHYAPIGEDATGHSQVRYRNEKVDQALETYSQTADEQEKLELMDVVITEFLKDAPMVPLFFNPVWFEYSTRNFTGWPSADNAYTAPLTSGMNKMPILLNLRPKK